MKAFYKIKQRFSSIIKETTHTYVQVAHIVAQTLPLTKSCNCELWNIIQIRKRDKWMISMVSFVTEFAIKKENNKSQLSAIYILSLLVVLGRRKRRAEVLSCSRRVWYLYLCCLNICIRIRKVRSSIFFCRYWT